MAKKKRKHFIKLNNKIKSLFGNLPFEDAITQLDDDYLLGLLMAFGSDLKSANRNDIIKYLRRVWSESGYSIRKVIVDYLESVQSNSQAMHNDKVNLILSYLKDENLTFDEKEEILASFIDKKISKITETKVQKKLFYLRMKKILDEYSEILNITFIGNDTVEFYAEHQFNIELDSYKLNLLHSFAIDKKLSELIKEEFNSVIEYLSQKKAQAIEEKSKELSQFIENSLTLPYFDSKTLSKIIKNIKEPIADLYHSPIPNSIVKKVINFYDNSVDISYNNINYLLSKEFSYTLFGKELKYHIYIDYSKKMIYGSIWTKSLNSLIAKFNEIKQKEIELFEQKIEELEKRVIELLYPIELTETEIQQKILKIIIPLIETNKSLLFKDKAIRRALFHFNERIKPQKEQKKREILLAKTIRDFKKLYPVARSLNREIIFHMGPTNSGKTYNALQELKKAESGYYLAPLRLLALEGYESLKKDGVPASLITGEEELIDEESTHISSTIEMLNPDIEVDVCVIDEIQLIADRDRGWAWANALIGAPAKRVYLTGSQDALNVVQALCDYLDEPLTVVEFERKNPLIINNHATPIKKIEKNTAIVTFSRKEVLALKNRLSPFFKISVVYGNLSPEVRRQEARRFREGESDILIATDAIAMGLNLPIKTILFTKDSKFDGLQTRELTTSEILQISGRAGRYGYHESGYVGALDEKTLTTIRKKFNQPLPQIELPISVMATLEHVLLIGEILQTENLYEILSFFSKNMEFEGPFVAANIDAMLELAKIIDEYKLDLISKYHLACAPVSLVSPYLEKVFHRYLKLLEEDREVPFEALEKLPKYAVSYSALLNAEDRVKEVSLYLWLSFKFSDKFRDTQKAQEVRQKLNNYIEESLKRSNIVKNCNRCGKALDLSYRFSICDSCYSKIKRGYRRGKKDV